MKNLFLHTLSLLAILCIGSCSASQPISDTDSNDNYGDIEDDSTSIDKYYTITWNNYDGTLLEKDERVLEGTIPTFDSKTPTRNDDEQFKYTFDGWTPEIIPVSGDAIYTAKYISTLTKAKLSFDLDGGSSPSYIENKYVDSIKAYDFFFDVTKEDYNFRGWSYNNEKVFDHKGNQLSNPSLVKDMTFKALYAQTVELNIINTMEEAGTVTGQGEYQYNTNVDVSVEVNQGYVFLGWYYKGTLLSSQTTYKYMMWSEDVTLEARFKIGNYLLEVQSYNTDLGLVMIKGVSTNYSSSSKQRYDYKTKTFIAAYTKTEEHRFLGWFNENNELVETNAVYSFVMPNHDYKLIAKWDYFNLKLDSNNPEAGVLSGAGSFKPGTSVSINANANQGYTFVGWYQNDQLISTEQTISFIMPLEDVKYTAKFSTNSYQLTVLSEDNEKGIVSGSGTYEYGSWARVIVEMSYITNDYSFKKPSFLGWYKDDVLVSTLKNFEYKMPAENVMLVAKFTDEDKAKGETIKYGMYPQSKVTDTSIINELLERIGGNSLELSNQDWKPLNWYSNTTYTWFIDLDINGDGNNDYRGVFFDKYRQTNGYGVDEPNSYTHQYKNGYSTGLVHFFKYEPIDWKILKVKDGDFFVMSNKIIDSNQYSMYTSSELRTKTDYQGNTADVYPNNYKYSDLRTFLNVDFYNTAFNTTENSRIQTTTVDNGAHTTGYPNNNNYQCGSTYDKLFALSYEEVTNTTYGFLESRDSSTSRQLEVTDYAACLGCYKSDKGNGSFWLRSPCNDNSVYARHVENSGAIDMILFGTEHKEMITEVMGIVPAMHIK